MAIRQRERTDSPGFSGKMQPIDIVDVICDQSGDQMLSNCRVETGKQGLSCPHHLSAIGLPLNAMECGNTN